MLNIALNIVSSKSPQPDALHFRLISWLSRLLSVGGETKTDVAFSTSPNVIRRHYVIYFLSRENLLRMRKLEPEVSASLTWLGMAGRA